MKKLLFLLLPLSIFIQSCQKDLCKGVVCFNDGACINGICSCPTGYEGPACEKETTPKSITITGVRLLTFPTTKTNGAGWDVLPSSGPDLFFTIIDATNNTVIQPYLGTFLPDATSNILPYNFSIVPIKISNISNRIAIALYDWDQVKPDEFLGGIDFNIYFKGAKFPKTLPLGCSTCATSWELTVTYEF